MNRTVLVSACGHRLSGKITLCSIGTSSMTTTARIIHLIAGARPNFMKVAPIMRAILAYPDLECRLIHTGQHYDREMSDVFFDELGIPAPSVHLDVGSGSHAVQTARIMTAYEPVCIADKPAMVVVVGDVNSTVACSLVAMKLNVPVAHVEAGLRSRDMTMPEEVNRMVTDSISDLYFVTEEDGEKNLLAEGKARAAIHFVGHVMIDNLFFQLAQLTAMGQDRFEHGALKATLQRAGGRYGAVTLHRPSNVDDRDALGNIIGALAEISRSVPLIFPVHPRTRARIAEFNIPLPDSIHLLAPLPYMEFLNLWKDAAFVLTDSGGLQEETTALGVPCLTARENTERPITISKGTNILVGTDRNAIVNAAMAALNGPAKAHQTPPLWDGKAAERIAKIIHDFISTRSAA